MKGLIEALQRIPAVGTLVIVLGCGALSSWGLVTRGLPALATSMGQLAAMYDTVLPRDHFPRRQTVHKREAALFRACIWREKFGPGY